LQHLIERAVLLCDGARLTSASMNLEGGHVDEARAAASSDLQDMTLEAAEYQLIIQALERSQGNVSEAARQLGVTRMALRYRMQKHDIPTDRW